MTDPAATTPTHRRIALVGYRGTGKSTIGRLVADRLHDAGWSDRFADTDSLVEQTAGRSIADIFAREGEEAFRDLESTALDAALASGDVIATGGGIVLRPENRIRLRESAVVFWLQAPADVLSDRIAADAKSDSQRPALSSLPAHEEVRALLAERQPLYSEVADYELQTDRISPDAAADYVVWGYRQSGGMAVAENVTARWTDGEPT